MSSVPLIRTLFIIVIAVLSDVVMSEPVTSHTDLTAELRKQLEGHLFQQPLETQGHVALMLYRVTGDKQYLNTARVNLYLAADRLQQLSRGIKNKAFKSDQLQKTDIDSDWLKKQQYRDYFFLTWLVLPELIKINQFSMELKGETDSKIQLPMNAFDYKSAFMDSGLMTRFGSRQATQVYQLFNLDLGDYRELFINGFNNLFPDSRDASLTPSQITMKWMTMVNLVIAASHDLQEPVDDGLLNWIPDYLSKNIDGILSSDSVELIAKAGMTMILTGRQQSPLVEKSRQWLSYHKGENATVEDELWRYAMLGWETDYYPDPALYRMKVFLNRTPNSLQPVQEFMD